MKFLASRQLSEHLCKGTVEARISAWPGLPHTGCWGGNLHLPPHHTLGSSLRIPPLIVSWCWVPNPEA